MDWENCIVYVNGFAQDENYIIQDKDIVSVREFPSAITYTVYQIANGFNMLFGGDSWTPKIKNWAKNKLMNFLGFDNNSSNNSTEAESLVSHPSLSGAKNQSALGKSIPLILGKTLFTPYIIGKPYTTIGGEDGKDVYFHCLYLLGYNDIKVQDISLGIYKISSNDGETSGVLPSENWDETQAVVQEIESGELALNYETTTAHYNPKEYGMKLELQQGASEISFYDQKVVQTEYNTELLHPHDSKALDVYGFSAKYPQKIEVEIEFSGLIGYSSDGSKKDQTVEVGLQMSVDGGKTWQEFGYFQGCNSTRIENNETISVFTRQKNETMRFVATRQFSYAELNAFNNGKGVKNNVIELRIRRKNEKSSESNVSDTVGFTKVRTWCYDKKASKSAKTLVKQVPMISKYRNITARLGFVCKAGDEIQGQMESLNCICTSKARIWDGEKWSKTTYPTDNPASLSLLALTGKHRSHYKYLIDDSGDIPTSNKINLEAFGRCYEQCDVPTQYGDETLPRFACDGVVLKKQKSTALVNQILSCCRGNYVLEGKQYSVVMDEPREIPVVLLNAQNIIEQNNTKSFDEVPDGLLVKYISAINGYQEDTFICKPNDCTIPESEMKLENLELPYITHPFRAKALGLYYLAVMKLRPETWQIKMGQEANLVEIGNLVSVQNDTISVGISFGAEIKGFVYDDETAPTKILKIITDGSFPVTDYTKDYGILVQQADGLNDPIVIKRKVVFTENGTYNELVLDMPISLNEEKLPSVGDIVTFGFYNSECALSLCMGKKDNGNGTFELTLVPYQEGIYTADSGIIDDFDSKVTPPQITGVSEIKEKGVTLDQLNDAISNVATGGDEAIPSDIITVNATARKDGIVLSFITDGSGLVESPIDYKCQIKKGESSVWQDFDIVNDSYLFDRNIDGYPEHDVLSNWKIRAKAVNVYGNESENWKETTVNANATVYGTWDVTQPEVNTRVSDRTITLVISEKARSDTREVYGNVKYKIQVQKSGVDTQFYKPNVSSDPYDEEDSYKDVDSTVDYVVSGDVYVQTMPLTGQSTNDIHDTSYRFRVVAFNEKNENSVETIVTETARCTSIKDITKANVTSKKEYIENLTALSSAFGFISDGVSYNDLAELMNYWTLNDGVVTGTDSSGNNVKKKGAFRVGGKEQYLLCRPIEKIVNGIQTIDYEIEFKVGNFTLSSSATELKTGMFIYDDSEKYPTKRMNISGNGIFFEQLDGYTSSVDSEGDFMPIGGTFVTKAKFIADEKGNLTLTNAPDSEVPSPKTLVDIDAIIYHLEGSTKDSNDGNAGFFTFTPNDEENPFTNVSFLKDGTLGFDGSIKKEIEVQEISLFNNSDKLRLGNEIVNLDTLEKNTTCDDLNRILGTSGFRWEM